MTKNHSNMTPNHSNTTQTIPWWPKTNLRWPQTTPKCYQFTSTWTKTIPKWSITTPIWPKSLKDASNHSLIWRPQIHITSEWPYMNFWTSGIDFWVRKTLETTPSTTVKNIIYFFQILQQKNSHGQKGRGHITLGWPYMNFWTSGIDFSGQKT